MGSQPLLAACDFANKFLATRIILLQENSADRNARAINSNCKISVLILNADSYSGTWLTNRYSTS